MATFSFYAVLTALLTVALLMVLLILIQKGRGGGLSSSFGGGGGSTAFGAKTGDVLTWATSIIFGLFLALAIGADLLVNARYSSPPGASTVATASTGTAGSGMTTGESAGPTGAAAVAAELAREAAANRPAAQPVPVPPMLPIPTRTGPAIPAGPPASSTTRPAVVVPTNVVPAIPAPPKGAPR